MLFLDTEDLSGENSVSAGRKLDDLIHLAELCVDLLQQNEEHHAEVWRLTQSVMWCMVLICIMSDFRKFRTRTWKIARTAGWR